MTVRIPHPDDQDARFCGLTTSAAALTLAYEDIALDVTLPAAVKVERLMSKCAEAIARCAHLEQRCLLLDGDLAAARDNVVSIHSARSRKAAPAPVERPGA